MFPNATSVMDVLSGDECTPHDRPTTRTRNENRVYVRKYYQRHRAKIALRKTERACRLHGRVPRAETILEHKLPLNVLIAAFREWIATKEPDDKKRVKRLARFKHLLEQLHEST